MSLILDPNTQAQSPETQNAMILLQLQELATDLGELKKTVTRLDDTWKAASGTLAIIRWMATVGAAVGASYAWFRALHH